MPADFAWMKPTNRPVDKVWTVVHGHDVYFTKGKGGWFFQIFANGKDAPPTSERTGPFLTYVTAFKKAKG